MKYNFSKIGKIVESDLKTALSNGGWVDSGDLLKSISVTINSSTGQIEIEALEYIQYLESGNFMKEFLAKEIDKIGPLLAKIIAESIGKEMANDIGKALRTK